MAVANRVAQREPGTPVSTETIRRARAPRRRRAAASLAIALAAVGAVALSDCGATGGSPNTGVPATLAPGGSTFTGGTLPKKLHTVINSGTLTAGGTSTTALTSAAG